MTALKEQCKDRIKMKFSLTNVLSLDIWTIKIRNNVVLRPEFCGTLPIASLCLRACTLYLGSVQFSHYARAVSPRPQVTVISTFIVKNAFRVIYYLSRCLFAHRQ